MADQQTDTLLKPDMNAVLSRTHLQTNTHGFLLPIFEAISNAMHGVEEHFGDQAQARGFIHVHFKDWKNPGKIVVSVSDNGVGLTDENYKSFKTPFSGHKLKQKGRGFGRFIAFKVFSRVVYHSRYEFFNKESLRSFRFDIGQDAEFILLKDKPKFSGPGLSVVYDQPLTNWHDLIRTLQADDIANEIGAHFLPYFLYRWLPQITIQFDENEPVDIRSRFQKIFQQFDSGTIACARHFARRHKIHRDTAESRTASVAMADSCRSADAYRRAWRRSDDGAYRDDASAAKA
jgi:hypothetical protein